MVFTLFDAGMKKFLGRFAVLALLLAAATSPTIADYSKESPEDSGRVSEAMPPPVFTFFDPSGAPTTSYILDTLCPGETIDHCLEVISESTDHNIIDFTGNVGTVVVTPPTTPFDTCFSYTAPFSFTGFDTVTLTVENQLGNTGTVDVQFLIADPTTPIDAGPAQELCSTTTGTLSAVSPDPYANSYWIVNSGTGILADPTSPTTTVTNLSFGNNVFIWVQEYPCGTTNYGVTQISVFDGTAPIADAGPDADVCSDDNTFTMAANDPAFSANGVWEGVSGTATVANIFDPNTEITNLGIGINCFQWNIDNGPCPGGETVDEICIYVYDQNHPSADAGPDQEICSADYTQATVSANAIIDPAIGTWALVSGSGVIDEINQSNTSITGCGIGDNVFTWSVENGPCGISVDTLVITIYDENETNTIDAGPDAEYCLPDNSHIMAANSFSYPTQGEWSSLTPGTSIADVNDPVTSVANLAIGDNVFVWTAMNGPCDDVLNPITDTVVVTIFDGTQAPASAGDDAEYCEVGLGPIAMSANAANYPASGMWTVGNSGTAFFADDTDPNTTVTGLSVGDNDLVWSIDNGICSGITTDTLTITVFPSSAASAYAGEDEELCTPVSSYALNANAPSYPSTGMWTLISGFGSFTDPTDPNTTVTGLAVGVSTYRWTVLNGACAGSSNFDEITLTIFNDAALDAEAGSNQSVCTDVNGDVTVDLSGSGLLFPQTGSWTLVSGGGSFTDPSDPNSQVVNPPVGENIYAWTVSNGPCTSGNSSDQVTITVYPSDQTAADAGEDQELCSNSATTALDGNTYNFPTTGQWTVLEGTGNFNDDTDPNTIVSGLSVGTNRFLWTITNGPCSGSVTSDEVVIIVFDVAQNTVDAGSNQDVCSAVGTVVLNGSVPLAPATGMWQTTGTGTGVFADPTDPNSSVSGMVVGENTFEWVISNGPCSAPISDVVSVFVFDDDEPNADAGADQFLCLDGNSTNMAGNSPVFPSTGMWSLVSGGGDIQNDDDPNSLITNLPVGENVFMWTVSNSPCLPGTSSNTVSIFVYDNNHPLADAGEDQAFCTPISSAVLDGNAPIFPSTGFWEIVSSSGSITDPSNPNTSVTGLTPGDHVFRWNIDNGVCTNPDSSDEVTITIFDAGQEDADAGEDQSHCNPPTTSITLDGNTAVYPASGMWAQVSGAATSITDNTDPSSTVTGLDVGTYVFEWTIDNGSCGTPTSDQVTIEIFDNTAADADAGADQELCTPTSGTTLSGNTPVSPATGSWTSLGVASVDNPNDPNSSVSGLAIGDNLFVWTIDNNSCSNGTTSDTVNIILFFDGQLDADAGTDQQICTPQDAVNLSANAYSYPATGFWAQTGGTTAVIDDPTDPNTLVSGLDVGVNTFVWTIENGPCTNSITTDEVEISVFDGGAPQADAGEDQELCSPTTTTVMAAEAAIFPGEGTWTLVSGTGNIVDENNPNTAITGLSVGVNTFAWTLDYSTCGTQADMVDIIVYDGTVPAAFAGNDQEFCSPTNSAVMDADAVASPGYGTWTLVSGNGTFTEPNNPQATVSNLTIGENIFVWEVYNGSCLGFPDTQDTVSIFIFNENQADAMAGEDQYLCTPNNFTTLEGNEAVFPASGMWTVLEGTGDFADPTQYDTDVTGLSVGINTFVWTISNGPCANATTSDEISVYLFDGNQDVSDAGPDQEWCTPVSSVTMAANDALVPTIGTWSVLTAPDGITILEPNNPNTTIIGLGVGQHIFQWTISGNACGGETTDVVSIFIYDQFNDNADAGSDIEVCLPETTTTLNGNLPGFPAEAFWTSLGSATVDANINPMSGVSNLVVGENLFVWTMDNGPCGSSTDTVAVYLFDEDAEDAYAGEDQFQCTPNTSTSLNANLAIYPGIGTWTSTNPSVVIDDPNDPNTGVSNLEIGENIFTWTIYNGPCANSLTADQVSIFIYDENQENADAGEDQSICLPLQNSVVLDANSFGFPATGFWTVSCGSGDFSDDTDPNATVTNLSVGLNCFVWNIDNGPCTGGLTSDEMIVYAYDNALGVADAGEDQEFCMPENFTTLVANPLIDPAVGTWTQIAGGSATIVSPNSNLTQILDMEPGVYEFVWTINNGPCWDSADTMSIVVYEEVIPEADAGSNQEFCSPVSSTTLEGNTPVYPAFGTWSLVGSNDEESINIVDPSDPLTEVTGLSVGENIFAWTVYNGPCSEFDPYYIDFVTIYIYDENQPDADAGEDIETCLPNNAVELMGNSPNAPATGIWTLAGGFGSIAEPNDSVTTVTDLPLGTNTFVWTITNGPCDNAVTTDTVNVLVFSEDVEPPYAGDDQSFCSPTSSTTLVASDLNDPNTGFWTVVTGSGAFSDPTNPTTEVFGLSVGINEFVWNMYNGPCENDMLTDTVRINIYDAAHPDPFAGDDIELCFANGNSTLMFADEPLEPAIGTWSLVEGGGTIVDINNPNTLITDLPIGTNCFVWSIDNGPCSELPVDTVKIFVFDEDALEADAGADIEICTPESCVTLGAAMPSDPSFGTWSFVGTNVATIDDVNDPNAEVCALGVGVYEMEWLIYNGPCEENNSFDLMTISVFDATAPDAYAGEDIEVCMPVESVFLNADAPIFPALGTWTIIEGSGTIVNTNDPQTEFTDLTVGMHVFEWSVYNGPCGTSLDTVVVWINDPATDLANAGEDQFLCDEQGATLVGSDLLDPAIGTWSLLSSTSTDVEITAPNNSTTTVFNLGFGENIFMWSVDNGACSFSSDTVSIFVNQSDISDADAGPDVEMCGEIDEFQMDGSVTVGNTATGMWENIEGGGMIADVTNEQTMIYDLPLGVSSFTWTVDNQACGTTTDTMSFILYDDGLMEAYAGMDTTICEHEFEPFGLNATEVEFPASAGWEILTGDIEISNMGDPMAEVFELGEIIEPLSTLENALIWTIDNGACGTFSDTINIYLEDCLTIVVPDAISPNNDGFNDQLEIPNVLYYPNSSIVIFNRWGDQVYEASPYLNDWDGTSNKPAFGEVLPVGTYYYVLDMGEGEEAVTGYIYLKR